MGDAMVKKVQSGGMRVNRPTMQAMPSSDVQRKQFAMAVFEEEDSESADEDDMFKPMAKQATPQKDPPK